MTIALLLHGAAVLSRALPLHPTDRRSIRLARGCGSEVIAIEISAGGEEANGALEEAIGAGATRAVHVSDLVLGSSDAHTAGFVAAAAISSLDVDVVLFGTDAAPEYALDIPASVAFHLGAPFFTDVETLSPSASLDVDNNTGAGALELLLRRNGWLQTLRIPAAAVIGISPTREPASASNDSSTRPENEPDKAIRIETLSFDMLGIDPALIRRRTRARGNIVDVSRAPVTLHSLAALEELLRPSG